MTVYIDDMYLYDMGKFYQMKMSHMIADTEDELHALAKKIGLKRSWYQGDHYDVAKGKRDLAIKHGAVPVSLRDLARMNFVRRVTGVLPKPELAEISWSRLQRKIHKWHERKRLEQKLLERKRDRIAAVKSRLRRERNDRECNHW